jgi:hypothetical protein
MTALITVIDEGFAQWDRAHLHSVTLADDTPADRALPGDDSPEAPNPVTGFGCLGCSPASSSSTPSTSAMTGPTCAPSGPTASTSLEQLGIIPLAPLPYWGWGEIPTRYGRRLSCSGCRRPCVI